MSATTDTGIMMGANDTFTIDELAQAAGMTPRNVRAYRTKGLLPPPDREGRASRYRPAHLHRLRDIRGLREAGLPLKLIIEAAQRGDDLGPTGPLYRLSGAMTARIDLTEGGPAGPGLETGPVAIDLTDRTAGAGALGGSDDATGQWVLDLADQVARHGVTPAVAVAGVQKSNRFVTTAVTTLADAICADLGVRPGDLPGPLLGTAEQVMLELTREAVAGLRSG